MLYMLNEVPPTTYANQVKVAVSESIAELASQLKDASKDRLGANAEEAAERMRRELEIQTQRTSKRNFETFDILIHFSENDEMRERYHIDTFDHYGKYIVLIATPIGVIHATDDHITALVEQVRTILMREKTPFASQLTVHDVNMITDCIENQCIATPKGEWTSDDESYIRCGGTTLTSLAMTVYHTR